MTRQSLIRIASAAAVAGLVGLAAGPAWAAPGTHRPGLGAAGTSSPSDTSTTLSGTPAATPAAGAASLAKIQAAAKVAIDGRIAALHQVVAVLDATSYLGADRAILVAKAQTDITGLTTLEATIEADTTAQQAAKDARTVVTGFRVYALVIPVDHMVRAADAITSVVSKLSTLETKWAADAKDPAITQLLTDMQAQTQAAGAAVAPLPAELEALVPSGWNPGVLSGFRSTLGGARQDLAKARQDAKQIMAILHSDHPKGAGSVTAPTTTSTDPTTSTTSTSVTG